MIHSWRRQVMTLIESGENANEGDFIMEETGDDTHGGYRFTHKCTHG